MNAGMNACMNACSGGPGGQCSPTESMPPGGPKLSADLLWNLAIFKFYIFKDIAYLHDFAMVTTAGLGENPGNFKKILELVIWHDITISDRFKAGSLGNNRRTNKDIHHEILYGARSYTKHSQFRQSLDIGTPVGFLGPSVAPLMKKPRAATECMYEYMYECMYVCMHIFVSLYS